MTTLHRRCPMSRRQPSQSITVDERPAQKHSNRPSQSNILPSSLFQFILFLLLLTCHWRACIVLGATDNSGTDQTKSHSMAQILVEKIKGNDGRPDSWNTLLSVLESSFSLPPTENIDVDKNMLKEEEYHNEARRSALHWLANQDDTSSISLNDDFGLLQRYALATIYFATGGDNWSRCSANTGNGEGGKNGNANNPTICESDEERYLSSERHLKWNGLNGKNGLITWLDLSSQNLVSDHFLPLELTLLSPSLELLWVSENPQLSGSLPEYIGEFKKLVSVSAYKTNLSGSIPDGTYKLEGLNSLRLYKSKFSGTISEQVGNLELLKWLWIHENDFTGVVPEKIGELSDLEGLTLHGNRFTTVKSSTEESSHLEKNIIPDSVCGLREKKLIHLWTDCEEGAIVASNLEGTQKGLQHVVKEGVKACSCCTRCFPKKSGLNLVTAAIT